MSETQQELKTDDRSLKRVGLLIILFTFGGLGVWSYFAPLDSAAYAPGTVVVKGFSKAVQHLEGGIVSRIKVKDGDFVEAGDLLLSLDDTQIKAQQEIVRGQFLALSALESRLIAEQQMAEEIHFTDAVVQSDDPRVADVIRSQNSVFERRKSSFEGKVAVLQKRIEQLQSQLLGIDRQKASKRKLKKLYNSEIEELAQLLEEGYADKLRLQELERRQAELEAEMTALESEDALVNIQIGEAEIQLLQLNAELQESVSVELDQAQTQLFDLREKLTALDDRVKRTAIVAPVSGYVLGMSVHTEGGVVAPGELILHIVPQKDDLLVSARVSPGDIDRVIVGQSAEVRFSSFKFGTTPKLYGEVVHLSADTLMDEATQMSYYESRLEILPESREKMLQLKILPGMPADVLIATGERTLWQYMVQPITDAFARSMIED